MTARSSTSARSRWCRRYEQRAAQRAHVFRAGDLRWVRGHLEGADHPPHAADVGHQRDPRHHRRRGSPDCGRREDAGRDRAGLGRGDPCHDQRGRRLCRDRPDARDVQGPPAGKTVNSCRGEEMNLLISIAYLVAAVLFILGLRQLSSPKGARRGNWTAAAGMVIALGTTVALLAVNPAGFVVIVVAVAIGAVVGTVSARRVQMTAMPQMVAIFNGVGGGAAALVSIAEFTQLNGAEDLARVVPSVFSVIIGAISFAGSCVAFAKLQELVTGRPITYPGQQVVNGLVAAVILALAVLVLVS